jgi:hypothetical protein
VAAMNRHERRAAAAKRRAGHNSFYAEYIKHLPQVPLDRLGKPGLSYLVFQHDEWCRFYDHGRMEDCNCNPVISLHAEPKRS